MPKQGEFVWHDLATSDMDGAINFYTNTIGWSQVAMEGSPTPYTMFNVGEEAVGGVMTMPEQMKEMGAPPSWTPCMATEDADATIAQVKELGGKLLNGPNPAPGGVFAVLQDPQGAVFEIYQAEDKNGEAEFNGKKSAGQFSWYDLNTTDWEAARDFYSKVFGWSESSTMDSPGGTYWMMKGAAGDRTLGGMSNMAKQMNLPAHWLCYVTVEDLDAALETAKSEGAKVMNGPMEVPGGDRIAHLMDPQGAAFALHSAS